MNTISKEFAILPGVIGSCLSVRDKGMLFSNLPDSFTESMGEETASNIGRMTQMAELNGLKPQTTSILYDKFNIFAMPVESGAILLVLCEPESNTSLIATTANMLAPEIAKLVSQSPKPANKPVPKPEPKPAEKIQKPQEQISYQTTQALSHIKRALFDTIGPVADVVYEDCLERWTANNPQDVSRLFKLVACISREIDNPALFQEFKEKITPLF